MLGSLTSLIGLVDERGEPVFHFYHKSLLDFLRDPHRSSDFHVNEETLTHLVQDRYYQVLQGVYYSPTSTLLHMLMPKQPEGLSPTQTLQQTPHLRISSRYSADG